jgi:hypothetical protein
VSKGMPPAFSMFIIILVPLLGNPDTTTIILIPQILYSARKAFEVLKAYK